MELTEFNEILDLLYSIKNTRNTSHYGYYIAHDSEIKLKKKRFKNATQRYLSMDSKEGYKLYDSNQYEVSLSQSSSRYFPGIRDAITKTNMVNGLEYTLHYCTDEYLLFFIKKLNELHLLENTIRSSLSFRFRHMLRNGRIDSDDDLLDILKVLFGFKTLRVESGASRSLSQFENDASSFLFTLGYNIDISFYPYNVTEDYVREARISRVKRSSVDEIEAPKRKYQRDLILFYQKGISAESADLQYLSFYHVIEHFFESIYNEDLLQSVRYKLTEPSFSYKRDGDLKKLVSVIQEKLRYKNEEFQINELDALKLVLNKFIPEFDVVRQEINEYDSQLVSYYKRHKVSFSNGNAVNLSEERTAILTNLAKRVYLTRNSIVHSKDSDQNKYLPFMHDKELSKEIILMRIIAEKIIIGSSVEL